MYGLNHLIKFNEQAKNPNTSAKAIHFAQFQEIWRLQAKVYLSRRCEQPGWHFTANGCKQAFGGEWARICEMQLF